MNIDEYYKSLNPAGKKAFADRAGTTTNYIETHLLAPVRRRRTPRRELFNALVEASNYMVTREELFDWFYPEDGTGPGEGRAQAAGQ